VLGDWCDLDSLRTVAEGQELSALDGLQGKGLVRITGTQVEITHPFICDLVESSIPAEARRTYHERALQLAADRGWPLEVRAEHAYRAGEPMSALMLLERMGDAAMRRGDAMAAVTAYRRALELARREMLETGDVMLEGAIVTFSRKLGESLERSGDAPGADGVLREALDLAGPTSVERARMLFALGRVAAQRDRRRDAMRLLGQALEIVTSQEEDSAESLIQIGIGRVRREEGDLVGAANAYRRSAELSEKIGASPERLARTLLELGETLTELSDGEGARAALGRALSLASESETPALRAMVLGSLGAVDELDQDPSAAARQYRDAARLAGEAGDASSHLRWRRAADALAAAGYGMS